MKIHILVLSIFISLTTSLFGQYDSLNLKSDTLRMQLKLTKKSLTPDCGVVIFTASQKFEVLINRHSLFPKKYVTILQTCPEFLGRDFFAEGRIYEAVVIPEPEYNGAILPKNKEILRAYRCITIKRSF